MHHVKSLTILTFYVFVYVYIYNVNVRIIHNLRGKTLTTYVIKLIQTNICNLAALRVNGSLMIFKRNRVIVFTID